MAVGLEQNGVALEGSGDFPAAREAEFSVELAGVVEAEDAVGLLGEEVSGFCEEPEVGIALDDVLEVGDEVGLGLDELRSRAFVFLALFFEFFGGFGDEEGGGEWRGLEEEEGELQAIRVRVRVWEKRWGCGRGGFGNEVAPPSHEICSALPKLK